MKYTRYNEENCVIDYEKYDLLCENLNKRGYKKSEVYVRKVKFTNSYLTGIENSDIPTFGVCMFFNKERQGRLYLEKKCVQNDVIYKSHEYITREQCEKILNGDIEWMSNSRVQLFTEFYLQVTINDLKKAPVMELDREIFEKAGKEYIVFNKSIKIAVDEDANLLDKDISMFDCINCDRIVMSGKKIVTLPQAINNILNTSNNNSYRLAFAL